MHTRCDGLVTVSIGGGQALYTYGAVLVMYLPTSGLVRRTPLTLGVNRHAPRTRSLAIDVVPIAQDIGIMRTIYTTRPQ